MKTVQCNLKHEPMKLDIQMDISEDDTKDTYSFWRAIQRYISVPVSIITLEKVEEMRHTCAVRLAK